MDKSWMPTTAGILDIIAGALSAIAWLFVLLGIAVFGIASTSDSRGMFGYMPHLGISEFAILLIILIPLLAIVALTITGGVFALKRRRWGLVLAGSIAAIIIAPIFGIPAVIFTALSKKEFE